MKGQPDNFLAEPSRAVKVCFFVVSNYIKNIERAVGRRAVFLLSTCWRFFAAETR